MDPAATANRELRAGAELDPLNQLATLDAGAFGERVEHAWQQLRAVVCAHRSGVTVGEDDRVQLRWVFARDSSDRMIHLDSIADPPARIGLPDDSTSAG
jgi:hypothetical protein